MLYILKMGLSIRLPNPHAAAERSATPAHGDQIVNLDQSRGKEFFISWYDKWKMAGKLVHKQCYSNHHMQLISL